MKKLVTAFVILIASFNWYPSFAQEDVISKAFGNVSIDSHYQKIYANYGFSHATANYCANWEIRDLFNREGKTLHGKITGQTASIGYIYGFKIAKNLYFELGPQIDWSNYCITNPDSDFDSFIGLEYIVESKCKGMAINIPINLSYRIEIDNTFSVSPFLGYNNKVQIQELDGLSKNRYNPGVNIGFSIDFNHFFIGYKYTKDIFSAFADNVKLNNHYISFGYTLPDM